MLEGGTLVYPEGCDCDLSVEECINHTKLAKVPFAANLAMLKRAWVALGGQLTMVAKLATTSAERVVLDRRRKRLETSSLGMASRPHDRQMDTAFVDHADWKLSLGPTCTVQNSPYSL